MESAQLIATARGRAGLTQAELARRVGTSQPAVSAYEQGRRSPSVSTLERLLAACGARVTMKLRPARTVASLTGPVGVRLRERRKDVRRVLSSHGARNPRVFGSVVRGEDTNVSDVDLLVDLPRPSYVVLSQLEAELAAVLDAGVDVTTYSLLRDEIRERVLAEAVPL